MELVATSERNLQYKHTPLDEVVTVYFDALCTFLFTHIARNIIQASHSDTSSRRLRTISFTPYRTLLYVIKTKYRTYSHGHCYFDLYKNEVNCPPCQNIDSKNKIIILVMVIEALKLTSLN